MEDNFSKEKDLYFDSYCNSRGAAISFYVDRVLNKSVSYDEKLDHLETIYKFINEMDDVSQRNDKTKHTINLFDNYLLLLSNDEYISDYLHEVEYDEEVNLLNLIIKNKIMFDQVLSDKEIEYLDILIKYNKLNKKDEQLIYEYFIKLIIQRESYNYIVSYESFKVLLESYLSKIACALLNTKNNNIKLKEDDIRDLFDTGNTFVLSKFYNDLYHVKRINEIEKAGKCNPLIIKEIKDHILSNIFDNYEEENKEYIVYEVGAHAFSLKMIVELLNKLGININNLESIENKLNDYRIKINSNKRIINGKEENINNVFKDVIDNHKEYLDKYPQLGELIGKGNSR